MELIKFNQVGASLSNINLCIFSNPAPSPLSELKDKRRVGYRARELDFPQPINLSDVLWQMVGIAQPCEYLPERLTRMLVFVVQQTGAGQSGVGLDLADFMSARAYHVLIETVL